MFGGNDNRGYTIVEVLLFLAISSFMFIVAAVFINGKQANAEFRQGINEMNSVLSAVVNDVSNGVYPSSDVTSCVASGAGLSFSSSTDDASKKCTYIGKMILFTNDSSKYEINTVAGRLAVPSGQLVTSLEAATPAVVPSQTEQSSAQWGLTLKKAVMSDGTAIRGIGFVTSFAKYASGLTSGAQSIAVYPIKAASVSSVDLQRPLVSFASTRFFKNGANVQLARSLPCDPDNPMQYDEEVCFEQDDPTPTPAPTPISDSAIDELVAESKNPTLSQSPNITLCFDGGDGHYGTIVFGGDTTVTGTSGSQRFASKIHMYTNTASMPAICGMTN